MKTRLHSSFSNPHASFPLLAALALGLTAAPLALAQTGYLGPFFPPHRGLDFSQSGIPNDDLFGRAEGKTWYFSNVVVAAYYPTVWGATNGGVKLSFDDDVFSGAEILTNQPDLSSLSDGIVVWSGQTVAPSPARTVYTRFVLSVTNQATGAPIPLTEAASLGLPADIGAVVQVTPGLAFQATLRFQAATNAGGSFEPALDFFDREVTNSASTAYSSFGAGFYYSNNPPVLIANNPLTVDRGSSNVITAALLAATDDEAPTNQLRFAVAPQGQGGAPYNGVLQLDGTNVAAGGSFTQGDIDLGRLTYLHNGNCETNDDFTFNVDDGDGGVTPTGAYTTYTFRINVAQPNLPPVALNGSASTGLQAPYHGFLPATNADCTPQTLTFRLESLPAKGDLTLDDANTGAFTYTPRPGGFGLDSFSFQVNDGFLDSASPGTFVITISNQPPVPNPGSITTRENLSVSGTLTATDPDRPPQAMTFTIVTNGTQGSTVLTDPATGSFTYTPGANAIGDDSFAFTVSDGLLVSTPAVITVTIRPNLDEGDLLVTDQAGKVVLVDSWGAQAVVSSGGLLSAPHGVAVESSGMILVMSGANGLIRIEPTSGAQSIVSPSTNFTTGPFGAWGLAVETAGTILVGDGTNGVARVDPATGARTVLASGAPLVVPFAVALDSTGQVYVTDPAFPLGQLSSLVAVDPQTGAQTLLTSGGGLVLPAALTVETSGDVLVADAPSLLELPGPDLVLRINPIDGLPTVLSTGNLLHGPIGIAVGTNGMIYIANMLSPTVVQIDPVSGAQTLFASGGQLVQPSGMAIAPRDIASPVLTCPTNLVVTADSGQCEATVLYTVTATDACDPAPVVTCVPPSGAAFPVGLTNVLCTATDASGNTNTCTFTVSVYPAVTNLPTFFGATNQVLEAPSAVGAIATFSVTATTPCQPNVPVTCTPPSGSLFPLGSTIVTCVAVDALDVTNTTTFTVTVQDTTPPVLTCPTNVVVTADPDQCQATVLYTVTATDACDPAPVVTCVPPSGAAFPVGRTSVLCTAVDANGNTNTGSFTVWVYPSRLAVGETWSAHDSNRGWVEIASSADGTKLVAVVLNGQIYTSTDSGTNWTARESSRSWLSVASSADGTRLAAGLLRSKIYISTDSGTTWTPRASDQYWDSIASSADGMMLAAAAAENANVYTSTDGGTNWAPHSTPDGWPFNAITSSADGTKLVAARYGGYIWTSTNSGMNWTQRATSRYWQAVASSADGARMVAAVYGGSLWTSTDSGVTWTPRMTTANRNWVSVASSADGTRLVAAEGGNYLGYVYTSTDGGTNWTARESLRTWRSVASSADGNKLAAVAFNGQIYTSVATQITLTNPPAFLGATNQLVEATVPGGAVVSFSVTVTNHCQPNVPVTCTPTSGSTFPLGTNTITCVAVDAFGVTNTAAFTVIVRDTTPPDITCPTNLVVTADSGQCEATVLYTVTATDACDPAPVVTCVPPSGAAFPVGLTNVLCTATDASGNTNTCTFTVSVYPAITNLPTILDATNQMLEATSAAGAVATFSVAATTPCQPDVPVTCTPTNGSTFPLGTNTVTCVAVDVLGVTNTATFTVVVRDTTPPILTCPTNLVVTADPGQCEATVLDAVTATDACDPAPVVTCVPPASGPFPVGRTDVFDASGNSNTCSFTVSVYPCAAMEVAGETWTAQENNRNWRCVASSANGSKLVAGVWGGQLHISADSGVTWTPRMTDTARNWLCVASSADGNKLVAVPFNDRIFTSTDSGATWTPRASSQRWTSVASSADGTKLVAGGWSRGCNQARFTSRPTPGRIGLRGQAPCLGKPSPRQRMGPSWSRPCTVAQFTLRVIPGRLGLRGQAPCLGKPSLRRRTETSWSRWSIMARFTPRPTPA